MKEAVCPTDQLALAVFKGQQTEDFAELLEKNDIYVVSVPGNCTDHLQPMELSVNNGTSRVTIVLVET